MNPRRKTYLHKEVNIEKGPVVGTKKTDPHCTSVSNSKKKKVTEENKNGVCQILKRGENKHRRHSACGGSRQKRGGTTVRIYSDTLKKRGTCVNPGKEKEDIFIQLKEKLVEKRLVEGTASSSCKFSPKSK